MSESDDRFGNIDPAQATTQRLRAVVAIPVYNEVDRIEDCLKALGAQESLGASDLGVLLFLNNCSDGTAHVVASLRPSLPIPLRVIERTFAEANAGWARREAMEAAAGWLEEAGAFDGVILTTDADSRVPGDWVARNLTVIAAGADAVAGKIALDPEDAARLPDALHARGRLEGAYETLLTELEAWVDPVPHDPWPRHWTTSGATLAVRLATYRQVGGMPAIAVGEDRAFVSSLLGSDARVRHEPTITVVTSGRLDGRAPGGAADTMKLRCDVPESPCDPRLEALTSALFRYAWRRRLRRLHVSGRIGRTHLWAPWLSIGGDEARAIARFETLGLVLAGIERVSPRLAYVPLRPAELPPRIRAAGLLLRVVRSGPRLLRSMRAKARPGGGPGLSQPTEQAGNA